MLRQNMVSTIKAEVKATRQYLNKATLQASVIHALEQVPRHLFVPQQRRKYAYENRPLPIGSGQTISQPYIVAIMTDLLDTASGHKVLELGTGSGYQAAVLSLIVDQVYSIEVVESLGLEAQQKLADLGYANIQVKIGDGYFGWKEQAPYDRIIVTAAGEHVPPPLLEQLKPGGLMIMPVGAQHTTQALKLIKKSLQGEIISEEILPVRFVPLTGDH